MNVGVHSLDTYLHDMKHPKEQSVSLLLRKAAWRFYMTLGTDGVLAEMFAICTMVYCQRNSLSIAHLHNREPIRMVGHSTESSTDQPVFFNNPPPPLPGVASPKAGFVNSMCLKSTPEWSIFKIEDLWQIWMFASSQCRLEKLLQVSLAPFQNPFFFKTLFFNPNFFSIMNVTFQLPLPKTLSVTASSKALYFYTWCVEVILTERIGPAAHESTLRRIRGVS